MPLSAEKVPKSGKQRYCDLELVLDLSYSADALCLQRGLVQDPPSFLVKLRRKEPCYSAFLQPNNVVQHVLAGASHPSCHRQQATAGGYNRALHTFGA